LDAVRGEPVRSTAAWGVQPLLEALPGPALLIAVDDDVLESNAQALELFGLEARGKKFNQLEPSYRVPGLRAALEAAKGGGGLRTLPEVPWPGAEHVHLEVSVCPIHGADGRPAAVLMTGVDRSRLVNARDQNASLRADHARLIEVQAVTNEELQTLNEELRTANDDLRHQVKQLAEAEEADARKNQFLAMLAHELRNPLAAAVNALHVIRQVAGGDDRHLTNAVRIADRQLRHEARLLDDLLDVSRIVLGKVTVTMRELDLRDSVRTAVESLGFAVQQRALSLTLDLPPDPLPVTGDATRLEQCVGNLVSNAVKFTPTGGSIVVTARAEPGQAVVTVRDTGAGIPRDMLEKVFDLFAQADTSLVRAQGGLGIGLTLARRLVELHGGTIGAHSPCPGGGSEFTIRLPLSQGVAIPPAVTAEAPTRPRRLLIVEDNRDARQMLRAVLELHGHLVWDTGDGAGAVRLAVERSPDIVILDLGLPEVDGFETARRIRRRLGQSVRLVALSGYGDDEAHRRGREAGFDRHLVKPVSPDELVRTIDSL
jgi:two-component system, sensor histidine kinase